LYEKALVNLLVAVRKAVCAKQAVPPTPSHAYKIFLARKRRNNGNLKKHVVHHHLEDRE
jgi:hypothetical protein